MSILVREPSTKGHITRITGMTIAGTIKCISYLEKTGDIAVIEQRKIRGHTVNIYALSEQGRQLVGKFPDKL